MVGKSKLTIRIRHSLEAVGVGGSAMALLGAMAAAPSCCLPLMAAAGGALGLGAFASYARPIQYVGEGFVALAVVGGVIGWRSHRKWPPLVLVVLGAAAIYYAYHVSLSPPILYSGFVALIAAAIWNTVEGRHCAACGVGPIEFQSVITCPHCGHKATETMPEDSCRIVYECGSCGATLRPKSGDCCVFCSYGTVKCPPIQSGACPC